MIQYVELRLYTSLAATSYEILPDFRGLAFDKRRNDISAISFDYPLDTAKALSLDDNSFVGAVIGFDDGTSVEVERYLLYSVNDEKVTDDGLRMRSVEGNSALSVLQDAIVYPSNWPTTIPTGHEFVDQNFGTIMRTLILRAKNRGTLSQISETSFSGTTDSAGAAWSDIFTVTYGTGVDYWQVISDRVNNGLNDVEMDGWNLRIYNGGTLGSHIAIDALEVRPADNVTEMITTSDASESFSTVLIEGDEGTSVERHSGPAVTELGRRRETYLGQSGITDSGVLTVIGDAFLQQVSVIPVEESVGLTTATGADPFKDFDVNDWVWVRFEGSEAPVERRIYQIAVGVEDEGAITVGLTLNSIIAEKMIQLQRRIDAYSSGGISGSVPNPTPGSDTVKPNAPTGLTVTSAAFEAQGSTQAALSVSWTAPTLNEDGTAFSDLDHYDVQWRYSTDPAFSDTANTMYPAAGSPWLYSPVVPGSTVYVRVRAVDTSNNKSNWVTSTAHTVSNDDIPPAQPSKPLVGARGGVVFCEWDGKASGGGAMPVDFLKLQVHRSTTSGFTPVKDGATLVGTFTGANTLIESDLGYNTTHYYKFIAIDRAGNASTPSAQSDTLTVTPIVDTDLIGQVIANANIKPGTIVASDKIFGLSITAGLIAAGAIEVGKLAANAVLAGNIDAGAITSFLVTGKVIQTSTSAGVGSPPGAGVVISSGGIKAYNGSNAGPTFNLTNAGTIEMMGTLTAGSNIQGATITANSSFVTGNTTLDGTQLSILSAGNGVTLNSGGLNFSYNGAGASISFAPIGGVNYLQIGASYISTGAQFSTSGSVQGGGNSSFGNTTFGGAVTVQSGGVTVQGGGISVQGNSSVTGAFSTTGNISVGNVLTVSTISGGPIINDNPTWTTTGTGSTANVAWNGGQMRPITSSARYKTNIRDFDVDLDAVYALKGRRYERINEGEDPLAEIGFIAEEALEAGLDEWVTYDDEGRVESFDYYKYVVALQAAVVDLNARLAALE